MPIASNALRAGLLIVGVVAAGVLVVVLGGRGAGEPGPELAGRGDAGGLDAPLATPDGDSPEDAGGAAGAVGPGDGPGGAGEGEGGGGDEGGDVDGGESVRGPGPDPDGVYRAVAWEPPLPADDVAGLLELLWKEVARAEAAHTPGGGGLVGSVGAGPALSQEGLRLIAHLVSGHPPPEVIELLLARLPDGALAYLLVHLERTGRADVYDAVEARAGAGSSDAVRTQAMKTAVVLDPQRAGALLASIAGSDPVPRMRARAIQLLPATGDPETGRMLVELFLGERDPTVRAAAGSALRETAGAKEGRAVLAALVSGDLTGRERREGWAIAAATVAVGELVPAATRAALGAADDAQRSGLAVALGTVDRPEILEPLGVLYERGGPGVRSVVLKTLGPLAADGDVRIFLERAATSDPEEGLRNYARRLLGE